MVIYTSYFSKIKKIKDSGITAIGIARFPPKHVQCVSLWDLAPMPEMLKMNKEQYVDRYNIILSRLDPRQILKRIELLSCGKDAALCCYEKPDDFCHRHLVADWLKKKIGVDVREYDFTAKVEMPSLF
jgi:hypothetical protein